MGNAISQQIFSELQQIDDSQQPWVRKVNSILQSTANGGIINQNANGGAENGGEQGLLRNGGRWSGPEGTNTQIPSGTLPQATGRVSGTVQEGNQGLSEQSSLRNSGNNRGLNLTTEQSEQLKDTAIVNDDGTPKAVYHFTENMDFETFGEGDIGFHFGSIVQAQKRGSDLKQTGRIIIAHLAIKNPIRIPVDIMSWRPSQTALKLWDEQILTFEQFLFVHDLQIESGFDYNSPAAVELRRILAEKGYDGIVYENHFEGDGESYIAFYPEQVIIIDDGKGVTQATSQNGAASFMPENSAQGGFSGEVETDTADSENASQDEETEVDEGSFFDEPSADFPEADIIADMGASVAGVERHSEGQRLIIAIARELGYRVVFDKNLKTELGARSNGTIDYDKKIIYLNPKVKKPLQFIFGHELTHFAETSEVYEEFIEAIRVSKEYKRWLQRKTKSNSDSIGLLEGLYREMVIDSRKSAAPVGASEAQQEMYADFCGETFFADGEKGLNRLLNSLQQKQRPKAIQFILDFVSYLKEKLSGNKQITLKLIKLESRYAELLKSAKENTAPKSGVKYDIGFTEENKPVAIITENILDNVPEDKWIDTVKNTMRNKFSNGIPISGRIIKVNKKSRDEFTHSKNTQYYQLNDGTIYEDKFRTANNLDDIILATTNYINEDLLHARKDNFSEFARGDVLLRIGNNDYKAKVIVGFTTGKQMILYDIIDFVPTKLNIKNIKADMRSPSNSNNGENSSNISANNTVPQREQSVNTKSMQKNKKHSISVDENSENDTEIGDIPTEMEALMQQYQNGDFDEDTYRERMDELYNAALERFGIIPEGENAVTPIAVPKQVSDDKITKRFVRTILETGKLTPDMIADTEQEILLGDMLSYEAVSDEAAMKSADRSFERNTAEADWQKAISGGIITKNDIATIFQKSINGEKLNLAEQRTLSNDSAAKQIFADLITRDAQWVQTLDSQLSNSREAANSVRSALNIPLEKVAQIAKQNPILQSTANGGIISAGDGTNDKNNSGGVVTGGTVGKTVNSRTESQATKSTKEDRESFVRRVAQANERSGRGNFLTFKGHNGKEILLSYTSKDADDTEAYRAVEILKAKGYDVDYSDGSIEANRNGKTTFSNNAVTTPDGKIIVSSNLIGTAEQTADHEEVHLLQMLDNDAFIEFQSVFCENIVIDSEVYLIVADDINKKHFCIEEKINYATGEIEKIGKYTQEELLEADIIPKFFNEIIAYLRQCYNFDAELAQKIYGGMFKNWQAVSAAIDKFNSETNQATSQNEAASFMPENSAQSGFSGEIQTNTADSENASQNSTLQSTANGGIINQNANGGGINGSQNTQLLAGGAVSAVNRSQNTERTYGANTEIIRGELGNAQSTAGIPAQNVAAGESGWISARNFPFARTMGTGLDENFLGIVRGVAIKNTDSIGRILSPELQNILSETVFKTENGTVISFFHWSPNSFAKFKYGDGAFHLGTLSAAIDIKRRDKQQRDGHILEGYVISKNPLVTPDLGKFGAYSVCEFLLNSNIITKEQLNDIFKMEGFFSNRYDAPANIYVRELLKSLGYDSYLYQNKHEGIGSWSVGVFDADQIVIVADNGVLKPNTGVTQATSQNGAASFMPENSAQGGFDGEVETDTANSENASQDEETEVDEGSFFDEPSADFPEADIIADMGASVAGVERHSEGQRLIIAIARELGYRVVFDKNLKTELGARSNGTIDYDKKIIYLNPKVKKPLQFIFGHELTHFAETSEVYEEFIEAIRVSKEYKRWLQRKTKSNSDSIGLLEGLYREMVIDSRKSAAPVGASEAQQEMYADFCGETFFADGEKGLNRLLNSLQQKQRPKAIQFILDFVSYLKEKLSGNKQITLKLIKLESRYAQLLKSAKENTAPKSGVKYSIKEIVGPSNKNYGVGVYLDSDRLANLSEQQRKDAVKSFVINNLAGEHFIAYDNNNNAVNIGIAKKNDTIRNKNGKKRNVLKELYNKYSGLQIKQEAIVLIDELITTAKYDVSKNSNYAHDWLDNYGKSNWDYWKVFIQDKNKSVWEATLNVANTSNGEKILYDIDPINMVEGAIKSAPTTTNDSIPNNEPSVKNKSMQKNKKHSISVDERAEIDGEAETEIGDIPTEMASLMQQFQNGEFDEDTYRERMDELYTKAGEQRGTIKQGEAE